MGLTICSERIQNQNRGNAKGPQWDRTERVDVSHAPWASTAAREFPNLWLQVRAWQSVLQNPWRSPRKSASHSQLGFSKSPLGRINPTLKKDRRSCWGKLRHSGEATRKGAADEQSDFKAESCNFKPSPVPRTAFLCCAYTTRSCSKVHWKWIKRQLLT